MSHPTLTNPLDPTPEDLRLWAYTVDASYPDEMSQDWDLCVISFERAPLILELASDENCPNRGFFLSCLYTMAGDCVRTEAGRVDIPKLRSVLESVPAHADRRVRLWVQRTKQLLDDPESYDYDRWGWGDFARDEMNADALIEDVKRRLTALAEAPPFRFKQTSGAAARRYMREMTTFEGWPEGEIEAIEKDLGVVLTDMFRAYLRHMGKARGHLFCGSDVAQPSQFEELRRFGQKLMNETSPSLVLPADAIVFLAHQGYQFTFLQPRGGFDCPVMSYMETEEAPQQIAESFAAFLDAEVRMMEDDHRQSHESGGHYITVHKNGGTTFEYPALASGGSGDEQAARARGRVEARVGRGVPAAPGEKMRNTAAIILGASGSVGQALLAEVARCRSFGHVIVVTRRPLDLRIGAHLEERLVPDMEPNRLTQAVIDALSGYDGEAVGFSALGVGAGTAKLSLEEHRAVDVDLNAAFARGLRASGKVQQLIFLSAMGADVQAKTTGSGAAGRARYSRVKGEAEAAVKKEGPAIVSIFRPALIVGSQHTPWLLSAMLPLFAPLIPARFRSIRTTEIARAMVAAALQPPSKSAIYTYPEMMALIAGKS